MITNNLITGERQSGAGWGLHRQSGHSLQDSKGELDYSYQNNDNMMITICTDLWKVTRIFSDLHNIEDDDDIWGR